MKHIQQFFAICLIAPMLLCSCSEDDGSGGEFYAVISSNPENLDPQLADDRSSYYIIKNIYATLVDIDESGKAINGAASEYSVSEDGLTYTFKLRKGLVWKGLSDKTEIPLTAYDYEYAFRRIYDPETRSPHVKRFSAIVGSMKLYNGDRNADFGVKAVNDEELEIRISAPDCEFVKLLAHPAASPCNEEIFLSTQGRYGLSAYDTFCCGAFYLTDWNYDPYWNENHITLDKLSSNSVEGYITYPKTIHIGITSDRGEYEASEGVSVDSYVIDNSVYYNKDVMKKYSCEELSDSTSFLFFTPETPLSESDDARRAIYLSLDREKMSADISENSSPATMLVPQAHTILGECYRELYPDRQNNSSSAQARRLWDSFLEENPNHDFNSYTLLVSDKFQSQTLPYTMISCFESSLEFYCMPYFASEKDFRELVNEHKYELYIDTVHAEYDSIEYFLDELYTKLGVSDRTMAARIQQLSKKKIASEKTNAVLDFEKIFNEKTYAIPISYEKKYLLTLYEDNDLWYDPFLDTVYYKYAKKL